MRIDAEHADPRPAEAEGAERLRRSIGCAHDELRRQTSRRIQLGLANPDPKLVGVMTDDEGVPEQNDAPRGDPPRPRPP
jgi:hypothetical protein